MNGYNVAWTRLIRHGWYFTGTDADGWLIFRRRGRNGRLYKVCLDRTGALGAF